MPSFRTKLTGTATSPTGIIVPPEIVDALGKGKTPPVIVTINDNFTYSSTIGVMAGKFMIPVSAERRNAAGIKARDEIQVKIELDATERTVELPSDFAKALARNKNAKANFEGLALSHRKEYVRAIQDAKKPETRAQRIDTTIAKLSDK